MAQAGEKEEGVGEFIGARPFILVSKTTLN
jgi:hypothetical protein